MRNRQYARGHYLEMISFLDILGGPAEQPGAIPLTFLSSDSEAPVDNAQQTSFAASLANEPP